MEKISLYGLTLALDNVKWHVNLRTTKENPEVEVEITFKSGKIVKTKLFNKNEEIMVKEGDKTEEINLGLIETINFF